VVAAADDERRRVVRDLHDGAQQRLAATAMTLRAALANLDGPDPAARRELVEEALEQAEHANTELRELAQGILPPALTRGGVQAGVTPLLSRMPLAVAVDVPAQRFAPAVESTAYFVISEALTNVIKHAQARHVAVTAAVRDGSLQVEVVDDGIGGADTTASRGLGGLQDRVSAIGGAESAQPEGQGDPHQHRAAPEGVSTTPASWPRREPCRWQPSLTLPGSRHSLIPVSRNVECQLAVGN